MWCRKGQSRKETGPVSSPRRTTCSRPPASRRRRSEMAAGPWPLRPYRQKCLAWRWAAGLRSRWRRDQRGMGQVGVALGKGNGQFAGWVHLSGEDVRKGFGASDAWIPCLDHAFDMIDPWHGGRTAGLKDDDRPGVGCGHGFDELVLVVTQVKSLQVHAFRLALISKDNGDIGSLGIVGFRSSTQPTILETSQALQRGFSPACFEFVCWVSFREPNR